MLKLLSNLKASFKVNKYIVKGDKKGLFIGKNTTIDPSVIFNNSKGGSIEIGDNCYIFENVIIATYGGDIKIGNNTSINPFCVIYGHGGLSIGDEVRIATHTVIVPANHVFENIELPIRKQGITKKGISIGNNIWIGAGVKILDGVTIENDAIIAAGAVVNCDIKKGNIVGGVPSKVLKKRY